MNETELEVAPGIKNALLIKPVRNRWAYLVIYGAVASFGTLGFRITQDFRILRAVLIGGPIIALVAAVFCKGFNMLVTHSVSFFTRSKNKSQNPPKSKNPLGRTS